MFLVPELTLFERAMKLASMGMAVVANNAANINTPGYKRQEIAFKDIMKELLSKKEELEKGKFSYNTETEVVDINVKSKYLEKLGQFGDLGLTYIKSETEFNRDWNKNFGTENINSDSESQNLESIVADVKPILIQDLSSQKKDGNNVNPDIELRKMAAMSAQYNVSATVIAAEFRTLKNIVTAR